MQNPLRSARAGRPSRPEVRRREHVFVVALAETGSVVAALDRSKVSANHLARLLDHPHVRQMVRAA